MNNKLNFLSVLLMLLTAQGVNGQVLQTDSTTQIAESFGVIPFDIKRRSLYVDLPRDLRGSGLGVVKMEVNDKAKIIGMSIHKLKIQLNNRKSINFYSGDSLPNYPVQVKSYYKFLWKYIHSLKITPINDIDLQERTSISLMVKFR